MLGHPAGRPGEGGRGVTVSRTATTCCMGFFRTGVPPCQQTAPGAPVPGDHSPGAAMRAGSQAAARASPARRTRSSSVYRTLADRAPNRWPG